MTNARPQAAIIQMTFLTCCHDGCAVVFGVTENMEQERRKDHGWFYCPNGHRQHFPGKSEAEKLKEQLAREKEEHQREINRVVKEKQWAQQEAKAATHDAKVARSHAKRAVTISRQLRQRIKSGTCPCCDQKFDNLEAHMKDKHPRYR
jgi:hypothetical protein